MMVHSNPTGFNPGGGSLLHWHFFYQSYERLGMFSFPALSLDSSALYFGTRSGGGSYYGGSPWASSSCKPTTARGPVST